MAYIILGIGGLYSLYWLLAFLFSMRTRGARSLVIPAVFLVVFLGVSGFGYDKLDKAWQDPDKLVAQNYDKLNKGMSPEEVGKIIGFAPHNMKLMSKERLKGFNLSANKIVLPPEVTARLGTTSYKMPREEAFMSFTILGETSEIDLKPKPIKKDKTKKDEPDTFEHFLGQPATKSMNGVLGLKIRIFKEDEEAAKAARKAHTEKRSALQEADKTPKEIADEMEHLVIPGSDEIIIEEGKDKDWQFEDNDSNGAVAKKICKAIEAASKKKGGTFSCEYTFEEEEQKCFDQCKAKDSFVSFYMDQAEKICAEQKKKSDTCLQDTCTQECIRLEVESLDYQFKIAIAEDAEDYLGSKGNVWSVQVDSGPTESVIVRNNPNGTPVMFRGGADAAEVQYWSEQDIFLDDDFFLNKRLLVAAYINEKLVAVGQRNIDPEEEKLKYVSSE